MMWLNIRAAVCVLSMPARQGVDTRFDFHVENHLGFMRLGCIKILLRCYL